MNNVSSIDNRRINIKFSDIIQIAFLFAIWSQSMTIFVGDYVYLVLRGTQLLIYVVMAIYLVKNHFKKFLLVLILILFVIFSTYLLYPLNRPALSEGASSMILQGFYLLIGYSIIEENKVITALRIGALIAICYMAYGIFFVGGENLESYDLVSNGLFWVVLFYLLVDRNICKCKYLMFILSFILMLVYGRRSHVLYVGIALVLRILSSWVQQPQKKRLILILLLSIFIISVAISYRLILNSIIDLVGSMGIYSRTLEMIREGDFSNLNGRKELYDLAWQLTMERPLIGNGIGSTMVRWVVDHPDTPNYLGCNTHNSILEVGAEFGIPGMIIFMVINAIMIWRVLSWNISKNQRFLLLFLLGLGVVPVLIGSSYLTVTQYALFVGYYFRVRKKINDCRRMHVFNSDSTFIKSF